MRRLFAGLALSLAIVHSLQAQQETAMTARGTFDVTVKPIPPADSADQVIGQLTLDKRFHGDLDATSKGIMLGAGSPDGGSAGYVAMEAVSGTLSGRSGSFVLQHIGSMHDGAMELTVAVAPGTGTGQLTGIMGQMTIVIEGGKHWYELTYTLP
jgi:hypothetical protein